MTTTDEALAEQIARATCGSPSDYEWRTWGEDDPGLRAITLQYAARLLPLVRKAQADAWDEAIRYSIECANETTDSWGNMYRLDWIGRMEHEIEENPHRTQEDA